MPITTVLAFWTDQQAKAKAALTAAQADVTAAQQASAAARTALATAHKELAELNKKATQVRAELGEAPTEADVAALGVQLTQVIGATRATQAEIVEKEAAVDGAQLQLDIANGSLAAVTARLAAATSAKDEADENEKERTTLIDKLSKPPLATIEKDAATTLTTKPWTDAKARIEADIPFELRDCAIERANVVLSRLHNERRRVSDTAALVGAAGAVTDARRIAYEQAEATFRDHAVNGQARFDQALAMTARVADPKQNALTDPERRSVFGQKPDSTPDAALQAKRTEAAAKRKALALVQIELDKRTTALEIARAKARAADVDKDPETDGAVGIARKSVGEATTARDKARSEFTAGMRADLAAWQLAVPDSTWRLFADFAEAHRLLLGLKEDHAPLRTTLTQAESDFVAALASADKTHRAAVAIAYDAKVAASLAEFEVAALARRLLGAFRGDS